MTSINKFLRYYKKKLFHIYKLMKRNNIFQPNFYIRLEGVYIIGIRAKGFQKLYFVKNFLDRCATSSEVNS